MIKNKKQAQTKRWVLAKGYTRHAHRGSEKKQHVQLALHKGLCSLHNYVIHSAETKATKKRVKVLTVKKKTVLTITLAFKAMSNTPVQAWVL